MIAGLLKPSPVATRYRETRMNDIPPAERGVGMVFQSYALYPHLSVAENMPFSAPLAGAKRGNESTRRNQWRKCAATGASAVERPKRFPAGSVSA